MENILIYEFVSLIIKIRTLKGFKGVIYLLTDSLINISYLLGPMRYRFRFCLQRLPLQYLKALFRIFPNQPLKQRKR